MKKLKSILFIVMLFNINFMFSQQNINNLLNQIAQNNPELKAIKENRNSSTYKSRGKLIPLDPEFEYKAKENNNYETGITQKLKFPSYYFLQYDTYKLTKKQQELIFNTFFIDLLTEASLNINKLIYLDKQINIHKNRKDNAKKLLKFFNKKLKQGETNQLAVNKAKLHLLKYETLLEELLAKKNTTLNELTRLNGGKKIDFDINSYQIIPGFQEFSKYKNEYFEHHPEAKLARINLNLANKRLKVAKHQWLPDFKVGVHTESDGNLKMHFGISIPLWQQFNHVNKARADYNKQVYKKEDKITAITTKLKQLYQNYKTSKDNYNQYLKILDQDNTRQLLRKSLKEGEISAINYYQEIAKLYQFQDKLQTLRFNMLQNVIRLRDYELLQLK